MSWELDLGFQPGAVPDCPRLRVTPVGQTTFMVTLPLKSKTYATVAAEHPKMRARKLLSDALAESLEKETSLQRHEAIPKLASLHEQAAKTQHRCDLIEVGIAEMNARRRRLELETPEGVARQLLDIGGQITAAKAEFAAAAEELTLLKQLEQAANAELRTAVEEALARAVAAVKQRFQAQGRLAHTKLALLVSEEVSAAVDEQLLGQEISDPLTLKECLSQMGGSIATRTVTALLAPPPVVPAVPETQPEDGTGQDGTPAAEAAPAPSETGPA